MGKLRLSQYSLIRFALSKGNLQGLGEKCGMVKVLLFPGVLEIIWASYQLFYNSVFLVAIRDLKFLT